MMNIFIYKYYEYLIILDHIHHYDNANLQFYTILSNSPSNNRLHCSAHIIFALI